VNKAAGIVTTLIIAFVFVAVLTHANGFSLAAGSLFTGANTLGNSLEDNTNSSGGVAVKKS
jgi:hypothetical protein